ncbi:PhnJ, carbon-phosphorus lyase complex subunit [Klebsiella pneumoniae subsp. pneumoniae DSM 30104 = JCM 1662 = NBRC 14940]|nr:PhnJ, carbon-phosphorus lyase complex subunit [Klebsiella pneumoniae subsp. pneumoniae DSM 30104 = JCM 1662 = NBRC 14940]
MPSAGWFYRSRTRRRCRALLPATARRRHRENLYPGRRDGSGYSQQVMAGSFFLPLALLAAIVGIGADKHPLAAVIQYHFVEVAVARAADGAGLIPLLHGKGMVVEIETLHRGIGRHGVDPLFAPGAEQLQRRHHVHFRVIEFRDRRRVHHVAAIDLHRIGVGGGDMAEAGDIFIQFHLHDAVLFQGVHGAGFGFTRLDKAQWLRDRHLVDQDLILHQRRLRDPVAGLDQGGVFGTLGGGDAGDALKELTNRHRVGGVIRALVNHLQHVVLTDDAGGQLDAAGAPAVGHWHFAPAERHLVAGNRYRFENSPADHALGLLVEVSKVIASQWVSHVRSPVAGVSAAPVRPGNRHSAVASDARRSRPLRRYRRGPAQTLHPAPGRQSLRHSPAPAAHGRPAPWPSLCARSCRRSGRSRG